MSLLQIIGLSLAVVLAYMTAIWLFSLVLHNASIVDAFWGPGFALLAAVYFVAGDGFLGRKILITTLVAIWGLRLSFYILSRNWGKGEDYRYQAMRKKAGEKFWWVSIFQVFLLQGVLLWLISAPILAAHSYDSPDELTVLDALGAVLWAIGFFFEAAGDWQLAAFKADPANKGRVMQSGLWRYTRHPNYFGDAILWWGYFAIAAATVDGLWTVFSPVLMTVLLLRVSGVSLLEKAQLKTKPEYKSYIQSTSAFVPWFPRRRG